MFMIRPSRIMAVKPRLGIIKTTSARRSCSRIQKSIPAAKQYTISTAITTSKLNSFLLKTSCSVSKSTLSSVKYQCPKCDFQAEDKNDMKKHVVVVHKSKPFVCFHCEETFSNFKVMQSHVRALHPEVGVIKEPYALVTEIETTKLKGSSKTAKVTKPVPSEHGSLPQEIKAVESGPALLQLDAKISDAGSNKNVSKKSSKRTMLSTKGTNRTPSDQDSLPQEIDLMPSSPILSKSAARASNVKVKKIRKNTKDEPVLKKSQSIQAEELAAKNQTEKNVQLEMVVDAMLNEESGILHEIKVSKSPSLQASVVQSFNKARDITHELKPKSKKIKKLNESKGSVKSAELTAKDQAKKNQQVDSEIEEMLKMFEKGQKSKTTTIKDNKLNIEQLNINAVKDKKLKDEDYLLKESHEKIQPIKQTMKGKHKKIGKQNIEPVIDESKVLQSNTVMSAKLLPKEQRKQLLKEQKEKEEQKAKEEKLLKEQKEKEERELKEKQLLKEQKEKEEQLLKEQKEKEERELKGEQLLKEQKEKEEKLLKEQKEKKLKEKQEQLLKEQKEKAEQKAKEEKLLKEQKEKLLKEMEERKIKEQKEKLLLNEQKEKEEQKAKEEKLLRQQEERELKEKQLLKEQKEKEEKLLKEQKEKEERELKEQKQKEERELKEQQLLKEQKEKEEKLLKEQKEKKLKEKQEQKEKAEQKAKEEKLLKEQKEKEEGELKEQNEKVQKEKLLQEKELLLKEQKEREIKEQKEKEQLLKEQKEKEEREIKEQKENEQRLKEQKESEEQKAKEERELKEQLCEKSETKHSEHNMPTDVKSIKTAFQQDIKKELKTDSQENKPGLLNWFKSFISRK